MQILISTEKLEALLQRRKEQIGCNKYNQGCNICNAAVVVWGSIYASPNIPIIGRIIVGILGTACLVWSSKIMFQDVIAHVDADVLQKDIEGLNEIKHPFSLVAVKDSFKDYPHRYLLYYDNRWGMDLFPNYKTQETNDKENVRKRLSNDLQIPLADISVEEKGFKIMSKYSVSDKVNKVYAHKLYLATIKNIPVELQADDFTIADRRYSWWSIDKMEQDKNIMEHNADVVDFVKYNII